jgi:hypothetical protein
MAVQIGSARVDERGKYSGGAPGDSTGKEVSTQNWYKHSKGWVVIRAKDTNARTKIAQAAKSGCANNNIGYSQSDRYGLYNKVKNKGFDPAKCTEKTNTDCSALVRVCCCFAGITVGDFNTAAEVSVLKSTGKFDILTDKKYTDSSDYLLTGDILCTKTKGHTVVVLTDGAKANNTAPTSNTQSSSSNKKPEVAKYTIKKGNKGSQVKTLQEDLNYVLGINIAVDGDFGSGTFNALIDFQNKYGLSADGIYGKASFNKMKELIG